MRGFIVEARRERKSASAKVRRNIKTFWRYYIKLEGKKNTTSRSKGQILNERRYCLENHLVNKSIKYNVEQHNVRKNRKKPWTSRDRQLNQLVINTLPEGNRSSWSNWFNNKFYTAEFASHWSQFNKTFWETRRLRFRRKIKIYRRTASGGFGSRRRVILHNITIFSGNIRD